MTYAKPPILVRTVRDFLRAPRVARLATIGAAGGYPHVVPIWFIRDKDDILFGCNRTDRKVRNLLTNPKGAVAAQMPRRAAPYICPQSRTDIHFRIARLRARMADYRAGHHLRLSRCLARQRKRAEQIEAHRQERTHVWQQLAQLAPQAPFCDVETETDQLVTHWRIAVYNSE